METKSYITPSVCFRTRITKEIDYMSMNDGNVTIAFTNGDKHTFVSIGPDEWKEKNLSSSEIRRRKENQLK